MFPTTPSKAKEYFNDYLDRMEKILGSGACSEERAKMNRFYTEAQKNKGIILFPIKL